MGNSRSAQDTGRTEVKTQHRLDLEAPLASKDPVPSPCICSTAASSSAEPRNPESAEIVFLQEKTVGINQIPEPSSAEEKTERSNSLEAAILEAFRNMNSEENASALFRHTVDLYSRAETFHDSSAQGIGQLSLDQDFEFSELPPEDEQL